MWHTFLLEFKPQIFKQTSLYALHFNHYLTASTLLWFQINCRMIRKVKYLQNSISQKYITEISLSIPLKY